MTAPCRISAQVDEVFAIASSHVPSAKTIAERVARGDGWLTGIPAADRATVCRGGGGRITRRDAEQFRAAPFYGNPL